MKSRCNKTNVCFSSLRGKPVRRGGQAAAALHPGRLADPGHHGVLPAGGQHPAGEPAHRRVQVRVAVTAMRLRLTPSQTWGLASEPAHAARLHGISRGLLNEWDFCSLFCSTFIGLNVFVNQEWAQNTFHLG